MNGKCEVDDYYNDVNARRPGASQEGFNDDSAILDAISVALISNTDVYALGLERFGTALHLRVSSPAIPEYLRDSKRRSHPSE